MGEAFDRAGNFLGSAEAATKREVLDKLMAEHGDKAHEIRIRSLASEGADYMRKHKPEIGGYYVVYDDGYTSFSPALAFENGYTRI